MTIQEFLRYGISVLDFASVYYVILLVRSALLSFAVCAVVFSLRKTVWKNRVFLKGALWSLFIPILFMGKMKFFYENRIGEKWFTSWTGICMNHRWICWLYLCGVFIYFVRQFESKRKLKKLVAGMERRKVEDMVICVTEMPVTPSVVGTFKHKIIMPKMMLKEDNGEEFRTILLHEKTHIRLGHLLFYFLWDLLRALLWINPLLVVGTKYFREDLEEICDWVTIRRSGEDAYDYGCVLLKSMKILQTENQNYNMYATFAGDKGYQGIRQRITRIALYRPYKRTVAVGTWIAVILCIIAALKGIQTVSYDRYYEESAMSVYGYDGEKVTFYDDGEVLLQMISYDDYYVYVDREAFEQYLQENDAVGDIFIVYEDFYKLPGVGGIGCSCYYEPVSKGRIAKIPYENPTNSWRVKVMKLL